MTTTTRVPPSSAATSARRGGVRRALTGALHTGRGVVGLTLTALVAFVAFIGPFLPAGSDIGFTTVPFARPGHDGGLLGGDVLGRDVVARTLHGGWQIILLGVLATFLGVIVGAGAGVVAAYVRGRLDGLIMRTVDVVLALPQLVFVLLLVSVVGSPQWLVVVAVGLSQAPQVARVVHAAAQDVCERDFVKAVAAWGVPARHVIRRQVLPNLVTPLMVETGLRLSYSIVLISGLNFLGLGVHPPTPSWGVMINENRLGIVSNPWGVVAPAALIGLLAVGTNMFADAIARVNLGDDGGEQAVVASALAAVVTE